MQQEPVVLPAVVPNLLVNGSQGIAVRGVAWGRGWGEGGLGRGAGWGLHAGTQRRSLGGRGVVVHWELSPPGLLAGSGSGVGVPICPAQYKSDRGRLWGAREAALAGQRKAGSARAAVVISACPELHMHIQYSTHARTNNTQA